MFGQWSMPNQIKSYLKRAQREGWAVGHFNVSNLETLRAIVRAANKFKSPVFIGTSEGESKFIGLRQAAALIKAFRKETGLPIFLNLDHGKSFEYIKEAVNAGYDAVHFDGSELPLGENIKITREIVKIAKKNGILVEGEVGVIGGKLTDPKGAEKFVHETGIDNLAINIGTWHGQGEKTGIDFNRLKEIKKVTKNVPLVLHGGSGVPDEHIKKAIKLGINLIRINTELRLAFTNALKEVIEGNEIVPYKYMPAVIEAVQKVVEEKIKLFGSENKYVNS